MTATKKSAATNASPLLDVWVRATQPGAPAPVAMHGVSEIVDGDVAGAFDRLMPDFIAAFRGRIVGDDPATP